MMSLNKRPDCGPRHLSSPPGQARWGPVGLHGPSQSEPPQSTARLPGCTGHGGWRWGAQPAPCVCEGYPRLAGLAAIATIYV